MAESRPTPRPRFTIRSPLSPEALRKRAHDFIVSNPRVRGGTTELRYEISIDGAEHHFWSPQIIVRVAPRDDGGSDLDARFGPDPYVWAMYVFIYVSLIVGAVFALVFGAVQWSLGHRPIALYAAPGAALAAALAYGASYVGQGLGSEQMYFLRASLEHLAEGEDRVDH